MAKFGAYLVVLGTNTVKRDLDVPRGTSAVVFVLFGTAFKSLPWKHRYYMLFEQQFN